MAKPSFNGESDPEISDPVKKLRPDPIHSTIPWFFSVWNLDILVKQSKQSTRLDAMNGGDGGEFSASPNGGDLGNFSFFYGG